MSEFDCSGLLAASYRFLFRTEGLIIQSWECCYRVSSGIFSRVCPLLKRVAMPKLVPPSAGKPTCSNCRCEAVNPAPSSNCQRTPMSELSFRAPCVISRHSWDVTEALILLLPYPVCFLPSRIVEAEDTALHSMRSRTCPASDCTRMGSRK